MKFWKLVLVASLSLLVASSVFAKTKKNKAHNARDTKIVTAQETLDIVVSPDISDPDKPKRPHPAGIFSATLYDKKALIWRNLPRVEKVSTGLNGQLFRLTVNEPGVEVELEETKYWPGVEWFQPLKTVCDFVTKEGVTYEFTAPTTLPQPNYRLTLRKGEKILRIPLEQKIFAKAAEAEFTCRDKVLYHIEEMEPMSHLVRVYAYWTALKGKDVRTIRTLYWRTIATGWSLIMNRVSPLDEDGYYHSTEWFFDEFAYALFPEVPWPDLRIVDHVIFFPERREPYVIRRRTFDINDAKILRQWREEDNLVMEVKVRKDYGDRVVQVHLSPSSLEWHPFPWKIEKGVIQK